jgi:hypothetical protein
MVWKIPLTYIVPFGVATWGALANSRLGAELSRSPEPAARQTADHDVGHER